jgi:hypothetical protein
MADTKQPAPTQPAANAGLQRQAGKSRRSRNPNPPSISKKLVSAPSGARSTRSTTISHPRSPHLSAPHTPTSSLALPSTSPSGTATALGQSALGQGTLAHSCDAPMEMFLQEVDADSDPLHVNHSVKKTRSAGARDRPNLQTRAFSPLPHTPSKSRKLAKTTSDDAPPIAMPNSRATNRHAKQLSSLPPGFAQVPTLSQKKNPTEPTIPKTHLDNPHQTRNHASLQTHMLEAHATAPPPASSAAPADKPSPSTPPSQAPTYTLRMRPAPPLATASRDTYHSSAKPYWTHENHAQQYHQQRLTTCGSKESLEPAPQVFHSLIPTACLHPMLSSIGMSLQPNCQYSRHQTYHLLREGKRKRRET